MDNLSQSQVVRPQPVAVIAQPNANYELESCGQPTGTLRQSSGVVEAGQSIEPTKSTNSVESASTSNEREKSPRPNTDTVKDIPSKTLSSSTRSCIKVHKQGSAIGKSVDLSRFNGYDELIAEVDRIFEFEGELISPNKYWMFVYTDGEGDLMLIGDDPWQEFCSREHRVQEARRPQLLQRKKAAGREMKSLLPTSAANFEKS